MLVVVGAEEEAKACWLHCFALCFRGLVWSDVCRGVCEGVAEVLFFGVVLIYSTKIQVITICLWSQSLLTEQPLLS